MKRLLSKKMGEQLYLDSGTLTPMLKRMEQQGLITRKRSEEDERSVLISLTEDGALLKEKAVDIPGTILGLSKQSGEDLKQLKSALYTLLETLHQKKLRMPCTGILFLFIQQLQVSHQYFRRLLLSTGRRRALF